MITVFDIVLTLALRHRGTGDNAVLLLSQTISLELLTVIHTNTLGLCSM